MPALTPIVPRARPPPPASRQGSDRQELNRIIQGVKEMRSAAKRRLALVAATATTLGAVTTLATGFTFGLFSASVTSAPNTFSTGTVTLGTPTQVTCNISGIVPGDSSAGAPIGDNSDGTCSFAVSYTGSVDAYLAVDISVYNPDAGTGGPSLYDGSDTGLQLYLADPTGGAGGTPLTYVSGDTVADPTKGTTFLADTAATPASTTLPLNDPPTGAPPVYNNTADLLATSSPVAAGKTVTLDLDYALPAGSAATGNTDVVLTIHAVQDTSSNVLKCTTITTPVIGAQCLAGTGFGWS
jgi:hypothetical protein